MLIAASDFWDKSIVEDKYFRLELSVDAVSVENVGPRKAARRLKVILSTEAQGKEWIKC